VDEFSGLLIHRPVCSYAIECEGQFSEMLAIRLVNVVGLYCAAGDPESGSAAINAGNDHVPLPSFARPQSDVWSGRGRSDLTQTLQLHSNKGGMVGEQIN